MVVILYEYEYKVPGHQWRLECFERSWMLPMSMPPHLVRALAHSYPAMLGHYDVDDEAWKVFVRCFRSPWTCVHFNCQDEWMFAYERYARRWFTNSDMDWVKSEAFNGVFLLKHFWSPEWVVVDVLNTLAFAIPDAA